MKFFFSGDWGTSTFRLRLVDVATGTVLTEIKTSYGIATAFECWQQPRQHEKNRMVFYQNYLLEQVNKITDAFKNAFEEAPIVISGMASSSIGMYELPYKELPFMCNGADLVTHTIMPEQEQRRKIIIISGVRSAVDVMRGEETILVGCNVPVNDMEQLFVFPGTHSKHLILKNGLVQNISTYMTGELFDLLSNKSILSSSIKKSDVEQKDVDPYFIDGVIKGSASNLLNSIFHVRTNQLFEKATPAENYHYLSGLLIGHELKDLIKSKTFAIILVCSEALKESYMQAFNVLGLSNHLHYKNADDALIKGQYNILDLAGFFI
ncbi:MAG: 2-dehydro-3-deoxygalactonokinase [Ferruginibacter sp.]